VGRVRVWWLASLEEGLGAEGRGSGECKHNQLLSQAKAKPTFNTQPTPNLHPTHTQPTPPSPPQPQANKSKSFDLLAEKAAAHLIRQIETSESDDEASEAPSTDSVVPPIRAPTSGRLSKVSSRRLCTEAMLRVLQQEIRKGKRRSVELSFVGDHLVITEPIGYGGFGRVFRGSWHKRPAAIKVGGCVVAVWVCVLGWGGWGLLGWLAGWLIGWRAGLLACLLAVAGNPPHTWTATDPPTTYER